MKLRKLIQNLLEYNLDAEVRCIVHNNIEDFSITYSSESGEGGTKQTADHLSFYVDRLCNSENKAITSKKIIETSIRLGLKERAIIATSDSINFDDFIEYGRNFPNVNIINDMPWSFKYKGHPITHENDECYIIPGEGAIIHQYFRPGDSLVTDVNGNLHVVQK